MRAPSVIGPDPYILRELRKIDPDYDLRFSGQKQRWEVWHVRPLVEPDEHGRLRCVKSAEPYVCMIWQGDHGEYLSPDMRMVAKVKINKLIALGDKGGVLAEMMRNNARVKEMHDKDWENNIEALVRDTFPLWRRAADEIQEKMPAAYWSAIDVGTKKKLWNAVEK